MTIAELYEMACMLEMENAEIAVIKSPTDINIEPAAVAAVSFGTDNVVALILED